MRLRTSRRSGFTLVEIMVVVAILALIAAMALPNFISTRTIARKNVCINNLRQIDTALQQWALEQKKDGNALVGYGDISAYLKYQVICPTGGKSFEDSYTITTVGSAPYCNKVPATHLLPWPSTDLATSTKPPGSPTIPGSSLSGNGNGPANPPSKKPPKGPAGPKL